mgnify:CR=1 FL=1
MLENKLSKLVNYYNAENYKYVIENCLKIIKKNPDIGPFIYNLLGSSFQKINNNLNAKKAFRQALLLDPNNLAAMNNLGNLYKNIKEFEKAKFYYEKIIKIDPNYINVLINYGSLKFDTNNYDDAIKFYKKALRLDNNIPVLHHNLGLVYMSLGDYEMAEFHLNEVLRINPKLTSADKLISRFKKYKKEDPHLREMLNKVNNNLSNNSQADLFFALGKAYEDLLDYKKSFQFLKKANDIRKQSISYDKNTNNVHFKNIKNYFDDLNFDNIKLKNNSKKKIFIVGMPRSGTSLVEQIISSHSNVFGAGELSILDQSISKNLNFNNNSEGGNQVNFENVRKEYDDSIDVFKSSESVITDKNPLNFRWIGLIKIIYPGAKIIHCTRNPKENCLSLYKNTFDQDLNWSYNLDDLLNFYENYSELMNFWKSKIPNFIYDISYENLVNDSKSEIEKLLKYCELDFEENCLHFHKNKRAIKTVSAAQARQKIYKTSLSSAVNFEPFLKDFFNNLDQVKNKF